MAVFIHMNAVCRMSGDELACVEEVHAGLLGGLFQITAQICILLQGVMAEFIACS